MLKDAPVKLAKGHGAAQVYDGVCLGTGLMQGLGRHGEYLAECALTRGGLLSCMYTGGPIDR